MSEFVQKTLPFLTARPIALFLCLVLSFYGFYNIFEENYGTISLDDAYTRNNLLKNFNFQQWDETGQLKEWAYGGKQIYATKKIFDESNRDFACYLESKELGGHISQCFLKERDKKYVNSTITFGVWACTDEEPSCIRLAIHNNGTSDNIINNVKTYTNVSRYWQFFTVSAEVGKYKTLEAYIFPDDGENEGSEGGIYVGGAIVIKGRLKAVEQ